jgi:hypothetical protein
MSEAVVPANEPLPVSPLSQVQQLRRRLKSIKRTRKQMLMARAGRLENFLTELVAKSPSWFEGHDTAANQSHRERHFADSEERSRLLSLLEHSRREYEDLIEFIESERHSSLARAAEIEDVSPSDEAWKSNFTTTIPRPLSTDVPVLHNQIEFLELEIQKALQSVEAIEDEEKSLRSQIEVLRTQLLEARHETIELRIQNADLSEVQQKAQTQLSWQERKEQLLQQLEAETDNGDADSGESDRVKQLMASSQLEIDRLEQIVEERDREIEELQMLLTRQATVSNGIAVGAAAIAQILDADELIQSEREKLRQSQVDWEQKLREAEIEISMERARIARERLEFELSRSQNGAPKTIFRKPKPAVGLAVG